LQRDLLEEAIIVSLVIIVFLFHSALLLSNPHLANRCRMSFIPMYYLHVTSNIMSLVVWRLPLECWWTQPL